MNCMCFFFQLRILIFFVLESFGIDKTLEQDATPCSGVTDRPKSVIWWNILGVMSLVKSLKWRLYVKGWNWTNSGAGCGSLFRGYRPPKVCQMIKEFWWTVIVEIVETVSDYVSSMPGGEKNVSPFKSFSPPKHFFL